MKRIKGKKCKRNTKCSRRPRHSRRSRPKQRTRRHRGGSSLKLFSSPVYANTNSSKFSILKGGKRRKSKRYRKNRKSRKSQRKSQRKNRRQRQRGGKTSVNNGVSPSGRGNSVNTLTAIGNLPGGTTALDHALGAENNITNLINRFTGQEQIISPDVSIQPIS